MKLCMQITIHKKHKHIYKYIKQKDKSQLVKLSRKCSEFSQYYNRHSTVTALHTVNNTVAKGFKQMAPPARTITVALDMSKAFDTINIHTLIRKLLQTNIPGTIIKFIANHIKGRKAYTTYRNHTSSYCQFKTGVPQGGVLSPTLFNIYNADIPPPIVPVGWWRGSVSGGLWGLDRCGCFVWWVD